jgi:hypothetical protein
MTPIEEAKNMINALGPNPKIDLSLLQDRIKSNLPEEDTAWQ